jgi:predicted permease
MTRLRELLRNLLRRKQVEQELDDELRTSVDLLTEERVKAGLTPHEARRQALAELGGMEPVKESVRASRGGALLHELMQDVRFAVRLFRKRSGFAAAAVITLALGIGANVTIFSAVRAVLLDEPPYPQPNRLVRLSVSFPRGLPQPLSAEDVEALQSRPEVFETIGACTWATVNVRGESILERVEGPYVSPEFFDVFGVPPALGRLFDRQEYETGAHVTLLSHKIWQSQFGGATGVVGRTIHIDREPWTVIGVMPASFAPQCRGNSSGDVWRPFVPTPGSNRPNLLTFARLPAGVPIESARQAIADLQAANATVTLGAYGANVEHLNDRDANAVRPGLFLLQSVALLLLLLTCTNLATLFLAHASGRHHELGVRSALGAGRWRLVRQLVTEAGLIATAGGLLGVALAFWIVPLLTLAGPGRLGVIPEGTVLSVRLPELFVALGLGWLTAILFGLAPAWLTSKADVLGALKSTREATPTRAVAAVRTSLIAAEVLLAVVLVTGTALVLRSFANVMALPLGFDPKGLVVANLYIRGQDAGIPVAERLDAALRERVGGAPMALASGMPFTTTMTTGFTLVSDAALTSKEIWTRARWVTPPYFSTIRQRLLRGRLPNTQDAGTNPMPVLVNETFEKLHGGNQSLLGRRLVWSGLWDRADQLVVVGIVADVRTGMRTQGVFDAVYLPLRASDSLSIVLRAPHTSALERTVRNAVHDVSPDIAILGVEPMDALVAEWQTRRRFYVLALTVFGGLAALLAAIGIYSVMVQTVGRRMREAGIRIALGARPGDIRSLLIAAGLKPLATGLVGGILAAWWVAGLLKDNVELKLQLYQVPAQDPISITMTTLGLLAAGVLACWIPTTRVKRVSPVDVLKAE